MNDDNVEISEDEFLKQRLPQRLASLRSIVNNESLMEEFSISLLFSDVNMADQYRKVDKGEILYDTYRSGYSIPMVSILDMTDRHIEPLTIEVGSKYTYMNILMTKKGEREAITYGVKFICNRWYYHEMLRSSIKEHIETLNRKVYNI